MNHSRGGRPDKPSVCLTHTPSQLRDQATRGGKRVNLSARTKSIAARSQDGAYPNTLHAYDEGGVAVTAWRRPPRRRMADSPSLR